MKGEIFFEDQLLYVMQDRELYAYSVTSTSQVYTFIRFLLIVWTWRIMALGWSLVPSSFMKIGVLVQKFKLDKQT